MNISWTADLSIKEKMGCGLIIEASTSHSDDGYDDYRDRRVCVRVTHEGTDYGIQLEWMNELEEFIDILTAIQLAVKNPPEWKIAN